MDYSYGLAMGVHALAAVVWVGGMVFAHLIVRPALADLEPALRLGIMRRVLPRFFAYVWGAIACLLGTGYGVLLVGYRGGIGGGPGHVDIMQLTALVMIVLFTQLFFGPWRGFRRSFDQGDIQAAAGYLTRIRHIVAINTILGLATVFIGAAGALLGS